MKKTEFAKLKGQTKPELVKLLAETKEKLFQTRRDALNNKVKNVHAYAVLRRDIARIQTLMQNKPTTK